MSFHLANGIGSGLGYRTKHWMPGFPHVLSWLIGVFGLDFLKLKLSIVAFGVGAYAATFAYVRCIAVQLPHRHLIAWVVALSTAVSPLLFDYSHRLMSEIPALCCAMTALWLCEVVRRSQSTRMLVTAAVALGTLCSCGADARQRAGPRPRPPAVGGIRLAGSAASHHRVWGGRNTDAGTLRGLEHTNANRALPKAFTTSRISRRSRRATWARSGKPEGSSKASSASPLRDLARRIYQNGVWYVLYGIADGVGRALAPWPRPTAVVSVSFSPSLPWSRSSSARSALRGTLQREMMYLVATLVLALAYPAGTAPHAHRLGSPPAGRGLLRHRQHRVVGGSASMDHRSFGGPVRGEGATAAADRQAKSPRPSTPAFPIITPGSRTSIGSCQHALSW